MIDNGPGTVGGAAQRQEAPEEEDLQMTADAAPAQRQGLEDEELLQGKFQPAPIRENKTGLPNGLKSGIESLSGIAMDHVNVHYDSAKPAQLEALAFTKGADIHVGPGQEKHLAHEAWHAVQQKQGRVMPTTQEIGLAINDDQGLEKEADVMGERALHHLDMTDSVSTPNSVSELRRPVVDTTPMHNHPIQGRFIDNNPDFKYLNPEYLQGKLGVVVPQIYKDLYYRLDDPSDINFPLNVDTPGSFDPTTKTISIPTQALQYVVERILKGTDVEHNLKSIKTAMAVLGHEMQHAVDVVFSTTDMGEPEGTEKKYLAVMDTELRAWSTEAIIYNQNAIGVETPGQELIAGWRAFDPADIDKADDVLIKNPIWARIKTYSLKNGFTGTDWKASAKAGNIFTRALTEKSRFETHVDVQAPPEGDVTIDSKQDLNSYPTLKSGGARVEKIRREGNYRVYRFLRRIYKVDKSVAGEGFFDNASGAWAPEPAPTGPVQIDDTAGLDSQAPGMKTAGTAVTKVRRDNDYKIYSYKGQEYRVHNRVVENGFFDNASGAWEPEPAATGPIQIDDTAGLDNQAPGMRTAGTAVTKVRRDNDYKIYSYKGQEYRVHNRVVENGFFDNASGSWES